MAKVFVIETDLNKVVVELESKKFQKAFETVFSCNILQPFPAYSVVLKRLDEKKK